MNEATPIQPVPQPILCNPYEEPADHWLYDRDTGVPKRAGHRRPAGYYFKTERTGSQQQRLFADEQFDDLPLVNALREDVKRWRLADYRGASPVTKDLLRHWARTDRPRRLFFCQREAVETVIYLAEMRFTGRGRSLGFNPQLTDEDLDRLLRGERPSFKATGGSKDWYPRLVDQPADEALLGLRRIGCKMATGSGKTVVMSMLIAWAFCNRGRNPRSAEFPNAVLVCCPNLTIKERLQVLRPEHAENYYAEFDIVPAKHRDLMGCGKVLVTNWHALTLASEHSESGSTYRVVDKGEEDSRSFTERVLRDIGGLDRLPIMVLNDEGHHCYRQRPDDAADGAEDDAATDEATEEDVEEARIWLGALDRINNCVAAGAGERGISVCVDLSATPFYIKGSGHPEGSPFPWLISDFGLVDAIESGIVKIPRLPVSDTTGRPDPQYFRLWQNITDDLEPGERLPGKRKGKPKPEVVYRKAQGALTQLAGQWLERFQLIQEATPGKEREPPVLIIVCDNTDIAEEFFRRISGEREEEVVTEEDVEEVLGENGDDEEKQPRRRGKSSKPKKRTVYARGEVFPEYFSNTAERKYTIRIDSRLLAEAESDMPGKKRSDAADELRRVVSTVGKRGQPGEHVRCVVSVAMLTEGWDANNVTNILGLRAFGSQLLCEQVVGRGLRRMDYTPDPKTGLLHPEYVDVYGIPFSVIPFKGRPTKATAGEDRPKNHVRALPERAHMRMEFPIVEGYVFALRRNLVRCDIESMEPLALEPNIEPTETVAAMVVGYAEGHTTSLATPFPTTRQTRSTYYEHNHIETIKFEIARRVMECLLVGVGGSEKSERHARVLRLQSRHQLFPQVYRCVDEYIRSKVDDRGCPLQEIGLERYARPIIERLVDRIEPDDEQGEPPLLPVLNRTKPTGSTDDVDFKTVRPCRATRSSHIDQVVLDTETWEASAAFRLESAVDAGFVKFYARNEGMAFSIPYEYQGITHGYEPDFLVRLADGTTLVLEIKGFEDNETRAKHDAAKRWISAVNNWGRLGQWRFHVCRDPAVLLEEVVRLLAIPNLDGRSSGSLQSSWIWC